MTQPTIVATYQASSAAVTSLNATTVVAGDWLVAIQEVDYVPATALTTPTGSGTGTWTEIGGVSGDVASVNVKMRSWRKTGLSAGTHTITVAQGGNTSGNHLIVLHLRGCDLIDGTPQIASGTSGTSQAVTATSPSTADALLVGAWSGIQFTGTITYTAPASMTERAEVAFNTAAALMVATKALSASGSSGTQTATSSVSASSGWCAKLFAISGPPNAKTGSALATIRLASSALGVPAGSAAVAATIRLAAAAAGSPSRVGAQTSTLRLASAGVGGKTRTGAVSSTIRLAGSATGVRVKVGLAVLILSSSVDDVLHEGAAAVTSSLRLAGATTANTRTTPAVPVVAVLVLVATRSASSMRAAASAPAVLYLSAAANVQRVVTEIAAELRAKPSTAVPYELVCVALVPQTSGAPALLEVDPIDWTGLSFTDELSRAQNLSVGCRLSSLTEAVLQRLRNPTELPSELWLYRAGKLVCAGPLLGGQRQGEAVTLQAKGILAYLDVMRVDSDMTFSQVDQFTIATALINQWQVLEYGNFGINTTGIAPSGVLRDHTYLAKEDNYVGQRVRELGQRENGFDVAVDPTSRRLRLSYPIQGVDRSSGEDAIVFDARNITSSDIVFSCAPGDSASEAYGTGTGGDSVTSLRSNLELRAKFGRRAVSGTWDGVSEQATLDAHVQGLLDARSAALFIPGPNVRVTPDADLAAWDVGDTVSYQVDGQLSIAGAYRLRKRQVTVSKTGQESVSLEFV